MTTAELDTLQAAAHEAGRWSYYYMAAMPYPGRRDDAARAAAARTAAVDAYKAACRSASPEAMAAHSWLYFDN
jgi:hypothetical protein